jgi:eukaryotic-like serine/threonine-protein kinase
MHLQVATSGEAVGGSRYRTLGRLGSGGMAEVDLAVQTGVAGSSRLCVLKRVRKDLAGREDFVSMFFEEARISASLNHPNIVQIYEVGGDEQDCFLAMEFLRGRSYAHLQRLSFGRGGDYRVDLEVLLATLAGLEHAHQRRDLSGEPMRLVHRDVSPPNVIVTYDGEIKVLDFGVAKSKDSLIKTEAGTLKGKVAYMAPEVVAGDPFDARADLYAVGVMLWEATAGRDRWPRMNDVAILAQLARGALVESPGAALRGLPARANDICIKSLAEDPDARYRTAAELRDALLELCEELGGRLGQAEIKAYMDRHFAADRAREVREVEAALREQRVTPGGAAGSDAEVGGFTKKVKRAASERPPTVIADPPQLAQESSKPRSRVWVAALAAALVAVVLAKLLAPSSLVVSGKGAEHVADKPAVTLAATSVASSTGSPVVAPPSESEPAAAVATGKSGHTARERGARPPKAAPRSTAAAPAPADAKPAAPRDLQLDRQDPWK